MRRKVFEDFTSFFNNELGELPVPPMPEGRLEQSFNRHFLGDRQKAGVRMSNLGKPAIVNALNKLGYSEPDPKGMLKYIFLLGDVFENSLEMFLQSYGFNIVSSQGLVEWGGIKGSYDFIIEKDGVQTLVEAKTMSGNYSRTFATNPNDDRGYVTQLALYSDATGIPGMWLCMDKSTGMMFAVEPNPSAMQMSLTRAEDIE